MNKVPFDIAITNEHNIFSEVAEMPSKILKLRKKREFAKRKDEKGKWKKMELTKFRKFSMFNSLMEVRHNSDTTITLAEVAEASKTWVCRILVSLPPAAQK